MLNLDSVDLNDGAVTCDVAIVDDDALVAVVLQTEIERRGFSASTFGDGPNAGETVARAQAAVLLLDLKLGQQDAVSVMRELVDWGYRGTVVLMSASNRETLDEVRSIGVRLGLHMGDCLSKPFGHEALEGILSTVPRRVGEPPMVLVDVEEAIANKWLEVWYQPQVQLDRNILCGVEALVRLRHPKLGLLPPASFLPSAASDPYVAMTRVVIETIGEHWASLGTMSERLPVSINASITMIEQPKLLEMLMHAWPDQKRRPPLIIEITEGEAVSDLQRAKDAITQLHLHDIELSLDDFGTGQSSFLRLLDLSCSEIKVDRAFVTGSSHDATKAEICRSVVKLAKRLGLRTVAEGVETREDRLAASEMGFDRAQGYLFAKPAPFSDFQYAIRKRSFVKTPNRKDVPIH